MAMTACAPGDVDPVVDPPWRLTAHDRIATAGSCFAQHVTQRLSRAGLRVLDTEPAHPILSSATAQAFGYGLFSARYGVIYTARQLLQLLRRAYGRFKPADDVWPGPDGALFDPFRPTVQPNGFPTRKEYDLDRIRHFASVRKMFEDADVFVFTLGLTECWRSKVDGAVYPLCPGVRAGAFDPDRHEFCNFGVEETVADLDAFLAEVRQVNPQLRMILTVSPVPLAATAEPRHVWTSTTASKAVLRVAAEEIARRPGVVYFPAYEIVTSPAARGGYFDDDLRSVSPAGVDHVMRLFFRHMVAEDALALSQSPTSAADSGLQQALDAVERLCLEQSLDPAAPEGA